jgi:hypothetical protein
MSHGTKKQQIKREGFRNFGYWYIDIFSSHPPEADRSIKNSAILIYQPRYRIFLCKL